MLTPNDVFTPGKPPLRQTNVYVARGRVQEDLDKALRRSFVPVVYGEYGAGKTSLARYAVRDADTSARLVNVESVDGRSFSSVLSQALEQIGYSITQKTVQTTSNTDTGEVGGKVGASFLCFEANAGGKRASEKTELSTSENHLFVTSPSDSKVLDICETWQLVLLLDELHKASREFVRELSSFIKAVHNKPCQHFKLLLVGTSSDAGRLVERDPGIDRVVQELFLPGMTDEEARLLVETGMHKLAIEIDDATTQQIVRSAVGSPSLVHYLALEIAEAAFERSPRRVESGDFEAALAEYVRKRASRLNAHYLKAIETTGPKRYRKRILHAMSVIQEEYVTMDQLVEQVSKDLGEPTPSTALSGPLRVLKSEQCGNILKDVERHDEGDRVYNYSSFSDPSLKAFVRMRYTAEQDGLNIDS